MAVGPAIDGNTTSRAHRLDTDSPIGPTRLRLRKPVIATVEGYALDGGLELGGHRLPRPMRQRLTGDGAEPVRQVSENGESNAARSR